MKAPSVDSKSLAPMSFSFENLLMSAFGFGFARSSGSHLAAAADDSWMSEKMASARGAPGSKARAGGRDEWEKCLGGDAARGVHHRQEIINTFV